AVSLTIPVVQDPRILLSPPKNKVLINCQHNDSSKNTKYWYRQRTGKSLVLIGYTYRTDSKGMEKEFQGGKMNIEPKSAEWSILTISDVSSRDSATYYCASSTHSSI
ncbi:hypothetical protein GDO86_020204, partial [Hymenochirus boettgeri]